MMIGSLGSIPFYTSVNESVLISGIDWETSARYAEHTRHNQTDMLEYVGSDPDKITFDIKLSAFLGVNPTKMLDRLNTMMRNHEAVKFVLGTMPIPGNWVITNLQKQLEYLHKDGTLLSVDVKITLLEYVSVVRMPVISSRMSFINRMGSTVTPTPSPGPSRKPVIPPTTRPVSISRKPTTKPSTRGKVSSASKVSTAQAAALGKVIGTVVGTGIRVVKAVSNVVKKYNVVEVLKNAISNRNYKATKASPAKPVVVRKSRGVSPRSAGHSKWINSVK